MSYYSPYGYQPYYPPYEQYGFGYALLVVTLLLLLIIGGYYLYTQTYK
ncbi:hypothetical protein [Halalkalibacillus sediminis]|nr:hypothetical protein [Halalkalibacillus sediminis]